MGRQKRVWIPNRFYHIVCRGNRREPMFREPGDFLTFLYILQKIYEKFPFELASYCLMTNHFHLLVRSNEHSISKIMSLLNKRYANYFNNQYRLTGHLYEKRFYDKLVDSDNGLLDVSRYIHLNPVEAKMVQKPEDYRWSSYRLFVKGHKTTAAYINIETVLESFHGTFEQKKEKYRKSLLDYLEKEKN